MFICYVIDINVFKSFIPYNGKGHMFVFTAMNDLPWLCHIHFLIKLYFCSPLYRKNKGGKVGDITIFNARRFFNKGFYPKELKIISSKLLYELTFLNIFQTNNLLSSLFLYLNNCPCFYFSPFYSYFFYAIIPFVIDNGFQYICTISLYHF